MVVCNSTSWPRKCLRLVIVGPYGRLVGDGVKLVIGGGRRSLEVVGPCR